VRQMKLEIFVEADHGEDGGSIEEVLVTTDVRLTVDNLPKMENAERSMRSITTESWAYINWKDDYDCDRGEGMTKIPKDWVLFFPTLMVAIVTPTTHPSMLSTKLF